MASRARRRMQSLWVQLERGVKKQLAAESAEEKDATNSQRAQRALRYNDPSSDARRPVLLDDDGLSAFDLNLANARGQRERIVEVDAVRAAWRARIVADDFLQKRFRKRDAAHCRRLELE